MWYVYILLCLDGSLYTGSTNNLDHRFQAHQSGKGAKYTRSHPPEKIIYSEKFNTRSDALKREIEIKSWDRQKKLNILKIDL